MISKKEKDPFILPLTISNGVKENFLEKVTLHTKLVNFTMFYFSSNSKL
jgi:hypothetical protein